MEVVVLANTGFHPARIVGLCFLLDDIYQPLDILWAGLARTELGGQALDGAACTAQVLQAFTVQHGYTRCPIRQSFERFFSAQLADGVAHRLGAGAEGTRKLGDRQRLPRRKLTPHQPIPQVAVHAVMHRRADDGRYTQTCGSRLGCP